MDEDAQRLVRQLDEEVATWRACTFSESTKKIYKSQRDIYLSFCAKINCEPIPVTSVNLCRYIAFLARTRAFSTVQQYLNIIRIIHLELGLTNPLQDNFSVKSLLTGIKRSKGNTQRHKLPINPKDLLGIRNQLDLEAVKDAQFLAAVLTCFYGLLRISSVTVYSAAKIQSSHSLRRQDVTITKSGCVLNVSSTKTIQFKDREFQVPLPFNRNHPLCPTTALLQFMTMAGDLPDSTPLFSIRSPTGITHLSPQYVRRRLTQTLSALGLPASLYGTHSLRRGGATWMLLSDIPLPIIKAIGDWRSDCVARYLTPDVRQKMKIVNSACLSLPNDNSINGQ